MGRIRTGSRHFRIAAHFLKFTGPFGGENACVDSRRHGKSSGSRGKGRPYPLSSGDHRGLRGDFGDIRPQLVNLLPDAEPRLKTPSLNRFLVSRDLLIDHLLGFL